MGNPLWFLCGIISSESFRNVSHLHSQARIPVFLHCNKNITWVRIWRCKKWKLSVFEKVLSHASVFTWWKWNNYLHALRKGGWGGRRGMPSVVWKCFMLSACCQKRWQTLSPSLVLCLQCSSSRGWFKAVPWLTQGRNIILSVLF